MKNNFEFQPYVQSKPPLGFSRKHKAVSPDQLESFATKGVKGTRENVSLPQLKSNINANLNVQKEEKKNNWKQQMGTGSSGA